MIYELWDTETRNLLAWFPTEDEALGAVRTIIEAQGVAAVEPLFLGTADDEGEGDVLARGHDLVRRAQDTAVMREPRAAAEASARDSYY